jgi:nicotinate-nucleotide pyrophosphorylase (carboxylating)
MDIKQIVRHALAEDIHTGDITTEYLDLPKKKSTAYFVAKQGGVLCGIQIAFLVFQTIDENVKCVAYKKDGDMLKKGDKFAKIEGSSGSILMGERVALNFLQRLSGIASMTRLYVSKISSYSTRLLDTRKTTPLLRSLEKYAVRVGGGFNHRFGLYDMIMIKDNHIVSAGSITMAVESIKRKNTTYKIEVEVKNLSELQEAVSCGVDRVMLDNMPVDQMREAVRNFSSVVELEASGNITIDTIEEIASTGVTYISSGALTHSYKSMDISLQFQEGS